MVQVMRLSVATVFAGLSLLAGTAVRAQGPTCGDVDEDGIANVVDALKIARGEPLMCAPPGLLIATGVQSSSIPGDDGDVQSGLPVSYVDNGDGTVSDRNTGLTWEKKAARDNTTDPGNPHDADNCYPWWGRCLGDGVTRCGTDSGCAGVGGTCDTDDCQTAGPNGLTIFEWVEQLNAMGFAGHSDWRIPNVRELLSLVDYGVAPGPRVHEAFRRNCGNLDFCTDLLDPECSCTKPGSYWSSTGELLCPWTVDYNVGRSECVALVLGPGYLHVRAVRGGW